jgi:hypothetical protein
MVVSRKFNWLEMLQLRSEGILGLGGELDSYQFH